MSTTTQLRNIQIHHLVTLKLTENNYPLWKTQFKPILKGHGLTGFIDGSKPIPPRTLPDSDAENPEFTAYEEQDSLLVGWLNSTLTPECLGVVRDLNTSKEVWDALEAEYAPKTKFHQMNLKKQLHNLRKGNKSLRVFLNEAKELFAQLAASGYAVSDDEKKQSISNRLNQAYDSIVSTLGTLENLSMDLFYSHLLNFDMRITRQLEDIQQPIAHLAASSSSGGKPYQNNNHNPSQRPFQYQQNQSKPRFKYPVQNNNTAEKCQICKKKGHLGDKCWFRYKPSTNVQKPQAAYIAFPEASYGNQWVTDTGATNHLTADMSNLTIPHEYSGTEQVYVGNGNALNITHTGQDNGKVAAARTE